MTLDSFLAAEPHPRYEGGIFVRTMKIQGDASRIGDRNPASVKSFLYDIIWPWQMPPMSDLVVARIFLSSAEIREAKYPGIIAFGETIQYGAYPDFRMWIGRTPLIGRSLVFGMDLDGRAILFGYHEAEGLTSFIAAHQQSWEALYASENPLSSLH